MEIVNIHDAKTRLSQLIARAVAGEPFIIARAGKPLVKVERLGEQRLPEKRRLGALSGKFSLPDNIKAPFADDVDAIFYGTDDKGE